MPDAVVAVIPMSPMGGRESEMVAFWRKQLQMDARNETVTVPVAGVVPLPGGTNSARLFDLASTTPVIDGKHKARILAAILDQDDISWIIKMSGEDRLVSGQKEAFLGFLKSISFEPGVRTGL